MEKSRLERFIAKYNLGGACESVKMVAAGTALSVRSVSDDKNVLVEVKSDDMQFLNGEYSVYETKKLRSLLGVVGEKLSITPTKDKAGKVVGLVFNDNDAKATFVLADESVIPKVPDLKKLPPMDLEIEVDEKFVSTFIRAKSALPDVDTFDVMSEGLGSEAAVVIGYSKNNTNRVNIKVKTKSNAKIENISFSANYLKEIFLANKELKTGSLKISSKGIAVAEFAGEGFTAKYFLVQINTED